MGSGNSDSDVRSSLGSEDGDVKRSEALAADREKLPAGYYRSSRLVGTFFGIGMSLVATYFAFQAGAAAVASINEDIGPSDNSSLFSIVWTISQPISILLFGRLSDRFGRRNFAIGANILGIIGGIVACTAKTMNTLIGAQVLLGLASGPPASYPLMTGELMSNRSKFLGTICVVIPNVIATGFGPYIGQRLVFVANWRWIFYIYLMMIVPGTVAYWFFYYPPSFLQLHGAKTRKRDEAKKIDFIGVFLLVSGLALFLLGVSWGGQPSPWSSPKILGLLISGAVCCVTFVLYECFANIERPIIPMRFFRDVRGFACLMVISSVMGVVNVALFIMYPQQVTYIFGSTSSGWEETAWLSSTAAFGAWAGIVFVGAFYHLVKRIRWQLVVGCVWMTAFLGAMASINRTNQAAAIVFSFFSMLAIGWGEVLTMLLVQYVTSDQDLGVAFAVVSSARTIWGSILTGAFIAIYTNKLPAQLQSKVVPAVQAAGLPETSITDLMTAISAGTPDALQAVPGMNDKILAVTNDTVSDSYSASYAYVYYFCVALGCLSIIAAACMRDMDCYLTEHVSRQIYNAKETGIDPIQSLERVTDSEAKEGSTERSTEIGGDSEKVA